MADKHDVQASTVLDIDNSGDEPLSNHSDNDHFSAIIERRLSRRDVLAGGVGVAMVGFLGSSAFNTAEAHNSKGLPPPANGRPPRPLDPKLGFTAIPVSRSDTAVLPRGYRAQVLIPWGDPITGSYPAYDGINGNTGEEMEQQVGSNHDGMHYFPFPADPNGHGLLCVNHEYVDPGVFHVKGPSLVNGRRPTDEVRKEIAAHGVSVVEIRRSGRGKRRGDWEVVRGRHNRRVTAGSPMLIGGPVRGSELVRTKYSPKGLRARGTINNCAHGYTPWGTYLTCEENWAGYFVNRIQLTRIDALFDALYGAGPASEFSGAYYLRRYPGFVVGVTDETFDQKLTSVVYRQNGSFLTDEGRIRVGTLEELLAQQNIVIALPREQSRYGVPTTNGRYRWDTAESGEDQYVRFDAALKAADPRDDYRNEPNTQGWIVEIDPFNPRAMPVKRTAMGRFAHEGCVFAPPRIGEQLAFYMGDDATNEYVYKFVTKAVYRPSLCGDVLDEGTLYVARFNEDGSGDWLALDIRSKAFRDAAAEKGVSFRDQADVLVNTRLAADVVGATKMDRPEWGAVHPQTRDVYMTMTNNTGRTVTDAANPRARNATGHIIRWSEDKGRAAATRFTWDIFVLAGPETDSQILPAQGGPALDASNRFASPDGLWVDDNGILWIQTDMSGSQQATGPYGENAMLAANPVTGDIRRFLVGPRDQETTGVVSTPDGKHLFVNFQHPGDRSTPTRFTSNWPDNGAVFRHPGDADVVPLQGTDGPRPRSATIVITRDDGGVVGL